MNLSQECEGVFLLQRSHCNYQPIAIAITMGVHYSKKLLYLDGLREKLLIF